MECIIQNLFMKYKLIYKNNSCLRFVEDLNIPINVDTFDNNMNEIKLKWEIMKSIENYNEDEIKDFMERLKIISNNILNYT